MADIIETKENSKFVFWYFHYNFTCHNTWNVHRADMREWTYTHCKCLHKHIFLNMFSKLTLLPACLTEFLNQQNETVKWIHIQVHFTINYVSTNMNFYLWTNMNLLNAIWIIHCMIFFLKESFTIWWKSRMGIHLTLTFFQNLNLTPTLNLVYCVFFIFFNRNASNEVTEILMNYWGSLFNH